MLLASAFLSLWSAFATPSAGSRPWCYWWWVNGHADRETITADLEAMKVLGFGGVLMFDSRGYWDDDDHVVNPKAELVWGSPEWYDLVEFAVRECARPPGSLGLLYLSAVKTITENHIRKERCSENISNSNGCRARGQRNVG